MSLEEKVGTFDSLSNAVRDFPESPEFKKLKAGLIDKGTGYLRNAKGELQPEIVINEDKAREMAKDFWSYISTYVAQDYLKLSSEEVQAKKQQDKASGKSVFDSTITDIIGVDEEAIYSNLKGRGSVTAEQIPALVAPIYESHDRRDTGKRTNKEIKDNRDADAALAYIKELKTKYPKSLAALGVPSTYRSIDEVQGLLASAVRAVPRDYPISIASDYKKAA